MTKSVEKAKTKSVSKNVNWDAYVSEIGGYGDENIQNEDIIVPRLKVVQPLTRNKGQAKDGDIIEATTGKVYGKSIQVVPLLVFKTRVLFDKSDFTLRCRSNGGIIGTTGEFKGRECATCEFSQWNNNERPECHRVINFAVAEIEALKSGIKQRVVLPPLLLSFSGASVKIARQIETGIRIMTRQQRRPIFAFYLDLVSKQEKSTKGMYYCLEASLKPVDPAFGPYLFELYKQYKEMNIDTEAMDKESVQEGAEVQV